MLSRSRVAVVALQGDYERHLCRLTDLGASGVAARLPEDLKDVDGIIVPGGESTTIGKLMVRYGLAVAIQKAHGVRTPIYGTCAGMILLARHIAPGTEERGGQATLSLMDITVARNAFGRQVDSFEAEIDCPLLAPEGSSPLHGVFIRAPYIVSHGPSVERLAEYDGKLVLARQGNVLAGSFHPELTADTRVHEYFLGIVNTTKANRSTAI